ncbi:ABC transporter substrate-binding protein [Ochrobactrum sp. WV_118_8]|uniref:ABC transporter substrate-binding protein n=1 Tax=Brucella anthropi TaxID=529 RepID=UPI0021588291|nr:ABC transporter substrate-binding protein [Brucella anthropi]MCR8492898.1 ABC transporter substrate-binding protein [Brucella anthropi]
MMICRRNFLAMAGLASALAASSFAMTSASLAADALNIGAYPSNPPFELKNADGTFEGFEIDIATEAAKRAGLEPEIADYGFQALFAATTSRRIDVAVSSITITPERLKSQSFTQPYYDSDIGVATKTDSAVTGLADLKGKTVGALSGSTGEKWVKENKEAKGFVDIKGYNSQQDLFLDLGAGRIDAVISDIPGMEHLFLKMKGFAVKDRIQTGEQYGLMMAKDHPLLGKLNDAITAMKQDGTTAAIHKKWFGTEPAASSSTVTVVPIPKP